MASSSIVTLSYGGVDLFVDPSCGTSILGCILHDGSESFTVIPDCTREEVRSQLAASSFIMFPYSNRIAEGRFSFGGKEIQLGNAERLAIHGDVRKRPWRVVEESSDRLVTEFDTADVPDVNWPWSFVATSIHSIVPISGDRKGARVVVEILLKNTDSTPFPAGGGIHPYFNRDLDEHEGSWDATLFADVDSVYPDAYGNRIPSGSLIPLTPQVDFRSPKIVGRKSEDFFDGCFANYTGKPVEIVWSQSSPDTETVSRKVFLDMFAPDLCTFLVMYNPIESPFFAVEPVVNATNSFNMSQEEGKFIVLQPDQEIKLGYAFDIWTEH